MSKVETPLPSEAPPLAGSAADRGRLQRGIAAGAAAAVIWGLQSVVSRQSVAAGLTAGDVTVLRFAVAGIVLMPLALRMKPFAVGGIGVLRALVLAALIGPLYSLVLVGGAAFAPAIHASVIASGLNPVLAMIVGVVIAGERTGPLRAVGALMIVGGLILFSWHALLDAGARQGAWRGDLLFCCNAALFVTYARLVRVWDVPARAATTTVSVLSLMSLPFWAFLVPSGLAQASLAAILWQALVQGLAVGVVATLLFTACVELIGPVRAAMFIPLMPITTAVAGALMLSEWPQPSEWAGMAVVLAGMALAFTAPVTRFPK
jgi:drug/metabolite transporter (DMT)-like permease